MSDTEFCISISDAFKLLSSSSLLRKLCSSWVFSFSSCWNSAGESLLTSISFSWRHSSRNSSISDKSLSFSISSFWTWSISCFNRLFSIWRLEMISSSPLLISMALSCLHSSRTSSMSEESFCTSTSLALVLSFSCCKRAHSSVFSVNISDRSWSFSCNWLELAGGADVGSMLVGWELKDTDCCFCCCWSCWYSSWSCWFCCWRDSM